MISDIVKTMEMTARVILQLMLGVVLLGAGACATSIPVVTDKADAQKGVVVGRTMAVLIGPTTRYFVPEIRFFEVVNRKTDQRFRVDVNSDNQLFILDLPPGDYILSRIQIHEGPFLATATPSPPQFHVDPGHVTYVGTWRFGIESPQYQRMVLISAVSEEETVRKVLEKQYPDLATQPITTSLLKPPTSETRLYENPPYPRVWYFRRHHTF